MDAFEFLWICAGMLVGGCLIVRIIFEIVLRTYVAITGRKDLLP